MLARKKLLIVLVVIGCLCLSGCERSEKKEYLKSGKQETDMDWFRQAEVVVVEEEGRLIAVEVSGQHKAILYEFNPGEIPPIREFNTFKVSASGDYVLWYHPVAGIMAFNIRQNQVVSVYKPTAWFSQYPYFYVQPSVDKVMLIDGDGKLLITVNLLDLSVNSVQIPYPFGTRFIPSPNEKYIVYISGYAQDVKTPSYLVTSIDGSQPLQFTTQGRIPDRDILTWTPDSTGILTIDDNGRVMVNRLNNIDKSEVFVDLGQVTPLKLITRDDRIYIFASDKSWKSYDIAGKMVSSIPETVFGGMKKPQVYILNQDTLLIEETLTDTENNYYRLWKSNWYGTKEVIIPRYHETGRLKEEIN